MEKSSNKDTAQPWSRPCDELLKAFDISPDKGLEEGEARQRRKKYGRNRLQQVEKKSTYQILVNQFRSIIILILTAASVLSFIFTDWVDGVAIAVAVLLNTIIGFFMELKAVRSMEALRQMEQITAKVLRSGRVIETHAAELVPGDIVVFEGGDIVSADMRVIEASKLQADESMLTGESVPVTKRIEPVNEQTAVAERSNMLFKGTAVTRGSGKAVVTATGMDTELGRISSLVEESQGEFTPLENRLGKFGRKLLWITLATLVVIAVLGIIRGKGIFLMIETAVALAVAAIPEGLPIVATITMARGMLRMAKRNALVNRLAAVETLGGTNVIFTDKTGTLTENRMTVRDIIVPDGHFIVGERNSEDEQVFRKKDADGSFDNQTLMEALKIGALCSNASLEFGEGGSYKASGEPLEVALMVAAAKGGIKRDQLLKDLPEQREESFDPELKMMATYHKEDSKYLVAVKGAPEAVLNSCSHFRTGQGAEKLSPDNREWWTGQNAKMAETGLRILALATKTAETPDAEPYRDLTFIGLVGMLDPPREGVDRAIGLCQKSGIRVVMVTGDHSGTALSVASDVGLVDNNRQQVVLGTDIQSSQKLSEQQRQHLLNTSVFARVSPGQKLDLVDLHQQAGSVVAMTGDGVNDAPALKKADIGVAMGQRGTQVAREAADMVLKDDSFSTIVVAIEQGRIIFNNIRRFIVYLLSGNASEIMIVFIASLFNAPLPILPLQILLLNIISDVFPALALGLGEGSGDVMKYPPRDPKESILTHKHWYAVFGYGLLIAVTVLAVFALSLVWLEIDQTRAVTVSFLTLAFARLWHVFNMRSSSEGFVHNSTVQNPYVWGALVLCSALLLMAVYIPFLASALTLKRLDFTGWAMVIGASLIPLVVGQLLKAVKKDKTN